MGAQRLAATSQLKAPAPVGGPEMASSRRQAGKQLLRAETGIVGTQFRPATVSALGCVR
jgi:hypothetical protein